MQPHTPTDYIGTGAADSVASILGVSACKWFQVVGISIAGVPGRLGDAGIRLDVTSPVAVGRGIPINAGGGQFDPPIALAMDFYDLTTWYLILNTGDVASVACAV